MSINVNFERGDGMGMTDRQFDSYQARLLRVLKIAAREIEEKGESTVLAELIEEIHEEIHKQGELL